MSFVNLKNKTKIVVSWLLVTILGIRAKSVFEDSNNDFWVKLPNPISKMTRIDQMPNPLLFDLKVTVERTWTGNSTTTAANYIRPKVNCTWTPTDIHLTSHHL